MANFAIVRDGTVENIVVADVIGDISPPGGTTVVPVDTGAEIGGTYDGTSFAPVPRPPPPDPTETQERKSLRALAVKIDAGTKGAVALINALLGPKP